jgi:hypothetical protein
LAPGNEATAFAACAGEATAKYSGGNIIAPSAHLSQKMKRNQRRISRAQVSSAIARCGCTTTQPVTAAGQRSTERSLAKHRPLGVECISADA